ncbi:hypothetical protein N8771_02945 [Euryarchaeota archaeon]|nr:hypothetical protein [Euryarchaeota archaeon]
MNNPREPYKYVFLIIIIFFSSSLWYSDWFEIEGEGVYTEGIDREPQIIINYNIDNSVELISVSIENATPLLQYWNNRDVVEPEGSNDTQDISENVAESAESDDNNLDTTRNLIKIMLIVFIGIMTISTLNKNIFWSRLTIISLLLIFFLFLIQVPLSAVDDFGLSDEGQSSTGGFDTANNDEVSVNQFAHFESNSGFGLDIFSLKFDYSSNGFDLGLLEPDERQSVIDNKPKAGDSGYNSYVKFEAEMNAGPSESIYWLIGMGVVLFFWYKVENNISVVENQTNITE